jgi:hypothetical protein
MHSALASKVIPAAKGNYGAKRTPTEICIHHKADYADNESTGAMWQVAGKQVSSNYGVYEDKIACYVEEEYTSYCQGNSAANKNAISIEVSNDKSVKGKTYQQTLDNGDAQGWPVSDKSLLSTIKLAADIAKRNNLGPLIPGKNLTWHSMYKATACPGPYLLSKIQCIADEANKLNSSLMGANKTLYGVVKQVIALSDKDKADQYAKQLNGKGEDAYYKVIEIGG